jgi:hypothetical protein
MSNFFDELEAQLHAAARARVAGQHAGRPSRLRWLRKGAGAVPILAAMALAVAITVVALTTLGHGHAAGPQGALGPPGPLQKQELRYIADAAKAVRRTAVCRNRGPAVPAISHGSPSQMLLSTLGVLRQPATTADRLPRSLQSGADTRGIYVNYIRLARVKNGISYYVVPAAASFARLTLPESCYAALVAALRAELPRVPAPLRAPTLSLQAQLIARQRELAQQQAAGVICLEFSSASGSGGSCGATPAQIAQTGMISTIGRISGVVPDGVTTVTIRYPASNGRAAQTVTTDVVSNVFATSIVRSTDRNLSPTIIWRSAQGKVLKTVLENRRNQAATSGFCSAKPGSNAC